MFKKGFLNAKPAMVCDFSKAEELQPIVRFNLAQEIIKVAPLDMPVEQFELLTTLAKDLAYILVCVKAYQQMMAQVTFENVFTVAYYFNSEMKEAQDAYLLDLQSEYEEFWSSLPDSKISNALIWIKSGYRQYIASKQDKHLIDLNKCKVNIIRTPINVLDRSPITCGLKKGYLDGELVSYIVLDCETVEAFVPVEMVKPFRFIDFNVDYSQMDNVNIVIDGILNDVKPGYCHHVQTERDMQDLFVLMSKNENKFFFLGEEVPVDFVAPIDLYGILQGIADRKRLWAYGNFNPRLIRYRLHSKFQKYIEHKDVFYCAASVYYDDFKKEFCNYRGEYIDHQTAVFRITMYWQENAPFILAKIPGFTVGRTFMLHNNELSLPTEFKAVIRLVQRKNKAIELLNFDPTRVRNTPDLPGVFLIEPNVCETYPAKLTGSSSSRLSTSFDQWSQPTNVMYLFNH